MKKQIILGSLIALANIANAQWTSNGNDVYKTINAGFVGIGTVTPTYKLDIFSTETDGGIRLSQNTGGAARLILKNNTTGGIEWSVNSLGSGNSHGAGNFSIYDNASNSRFFIKGSNGNIGIGTTTPVTKLDILGDLRVVCPTNNTAGIEILNSGNTAFSRFKVYGSGQTYIGTFNSPANDNDPTKSVLTIGQSNANYKAINIVNNTVTNNPASLFWVYGDGRTEIKTSAGNAGLKITQDGNTAAVLRLEHMTASEGNWALMGFGSGMAEGAGNFGITDANAVATRLFISGSSTNPAGVSPGNVGIGTNVPTAKLTVAGNISIAGGGSFGAGVNIGTALTVASPHYGAALTVNGKLVAKEIIVTNNWADYVFDKKYVLNSLDYVESYIKENKHLPNVPSSKEVEENGVSIGEMSKIQMEKIEELTLYIIELKKEIDTLKKTINK